MEMILMGAGTCSSPPYPARLAGNARVVGVSFEDLGAKRPAFGWAGAELDRPASAQASSARSFPSPQVIKKETFAT